MTITMLRCQACKEIYVFIRHYNLTELIAWDNIEQSKLVKLRDHPPSSADINQWASEPFDLRKFYPDMRSN